MISELPCLSKLPCLYCVVVLLHCEHPAIVCVLSIFSSNKSFRAATWLSQSRSPMMPHICYPSFLSPLYLSIICTQYVILLPVIYSSPLYPFCPRFPLYRPFLVVFTLHPCISPVCSVATALQHTRTHYPPKTSEINVFSSRF